VIDRLQGFFGFTRTPFGRDLAPGMLHRHTSHGEAVARIGWCVTEHRIGVITGEVGAGKTVAVRAALHALDPTRHTIIYLPNPTVGVRGIHHQIVAALGARPLTHHATVVPQTVDALAVEQAERGRTPVLVIDEAHLLDHDQLESIRMLTDGACSHRQRQITKSRRSACSMAGNSQFQRAFPSCRCNATACSVTVARSRAISAFAAPNAASWLDWPGRPGTEAANASNAPCLATRHALTTVERSTPVGGLPLGGLPTHDRHPNLVLLRRRQPPARLPPRHR
jgi:hypothetical protein